MSSERRAGAGIRASGDGGRAARRGGAAGSGTGRRGAGEPERGGAFEAVGRVVCRSQRVPNAGAARGARLWRGRGGAETGRRAQAEGAAERAEQAAKARVGPDQGDGRRILQQGAEAAGDAGGFGDGSKNPAAAAGQVGRAGPGGPGFRRARPGRRRAGGEDGEAGGGAAQAGPEEEQKGARVRCQISRRPAQGDGLAETVDDGAEAGGEVHERNRNTDGWGWARIFAPVGAVRGDEGLCGGLRPTNDAGEPYHVSATWSRKRHDRLCLPRYRGRHKAHEPV